MVRRRKLAITLAALYLACGGACSSQDRQPEEYDAAPAVELLGEYDVTWRCDPGAEASCLGPSPLPLLDRVVVSGDALTWSGCEECDLAGVLVELGAGAGCVRWTPTTTWGIELVGDSLACPRGPEWVGALEYLRYPGAPLARYEYALTAP